MNDYREDWDMSTTEGSQCFASAIMSRIVGVDNAEEEDRKWLAEYLKVNSAKMPTKPANSTLDDSLRKLFFYHAGTQEKGGLAWMTEQEFYAAAREAIANFIRGAVAATAQQRVHQGWPINEPAFCPADELLAIAKKLDPLPTSGEHR